jgi:hypothetical protein
VGDRCGIQQRPSLSEPDLYQLPIDVAEGAMAKRTPPESLAFVSI